MADAIQTTQQVVLSVRMKGDAGPQTGDVVLGGASYQDFSPTIGYDKNEVIVKDGTLYRAKETMDPQPWDPNNWEALTDITIRLEDFKPFTAYKEHEFVKYNESLYRAKYDFTSDDAFDIRDWEGIDTVDVDIQDFQPRNTYDKYETIVHDGKLWRAKVAFTSIAQFNPNDWELLTDLKVMDFEPNTDYRQNNLIVVAGVLYRALADFTSSSQFNPDNWERLNVTGVNDFLPNNYYIKGSMISHDGKLYLAKEAFTSGVAFDINDWAIQNDIQIGEFLANEFYPENHVVTYGGQIFRAKVEFTSGGSFDPADWELIDPSRILDFEPYKFYYKGEPVYYEGNLYIAKVDFTAGNTFNSNNWNELSLHTLQMVYENSSNNFANETEVHPPLGTTFIEKIFAPDSDSHIFTFTDSSQGDVLKIQTINADGGTSGIISDKQSDTQEEEIYQATSQDAILKVGVKRDGGYPYSFINMKDNDDEEFLMTVNDVNSTVTFTPNIQKAFTDALCKASKTQRGTVKIDEQTIRMDSNDIISAYSIARIWSADTDYYEGDIVNYNERFFIAKGDFTSGSDFNHANWYTTKPILQQYKTGAVYSTGDLIRYEDVDDDTVYIYYANKDISNAPATRNDADWTLIKVDAKYVKYDNSSTLFLNSTNVQDAITELDNDEYYAVKPYDETTRYLFTTAPVGSAAPTAKVGKVTICLFVE